MTEILVTGATGNVGGQVARQLGAVARPFSRRMGGDLSKPDTLEAALPGVDQVFLIWPFLDTEGAPAVLETIGRHAKRVVYVSSSGAGTHHDPINLMHAGMERLIEASGLEWTVLRADTIASNALGWAGQIRASGVVRGPGIAATAVVHEADVAAAAVTVLREAGHAGAKHVLTGPEVLSRSDQVRLIGEAAGRTLRFEAQPVEEARRQMLGDGRPPALVEALLAAASRPPSELVTGTVEELTGSPARTFASWAREHAEVYSSG